MWTRSAQQANGKFSYTVWNLQNEVVAQGEADSARGAEICAENAQRGVFFSSDEPSMTLEEIFADMDDAGLLAELGL